MKIGITGGIGSGKSTVTKYLVKKGYEVIDCDKLARQVVEKGSPALGKLAEAFGTGILDEEGNLNRAATAELVFHDEEKREQLNSITHSAIYDIIDSIKKSVKGVIHEYNSGSDSHYELELLMDAYPFVCEPGMDVAGLLKDAATVMEKELKTTVDFKLKKTATRGDGNAYNIL